MRNIYYNREKHESIVYSHHSMLYFDLLVAVLFFVIQFSVLPYLDIAKAISQPGEKTNTKTKHRLVFVDSNAIISIKNSVYDKHAHVRTYEVFS